MQRETTYYQRLLVMSLVLASCRVPQPGLASTVIKSPSPTNQTSPQPPSGGQTQNIPNLIDLMVESIIWRKQGSGGQFIASAGGTGTGAFGLFVTFASSEAVDK